MNMTDQHQVKTGTLWGVYRYDKPGSDNAYLYLDTLSHTRKDAIEIFRREYGHIEWLKSLDVFVQKCFVVQAGGNKYRFDITPTKALK